MANLKDLETKGFTVIPSFLSDTEVHRCADDFSQQPFDANNRNYAIVPVSPKTRDWLTERFQEILARIRSSTDLHVDHPIYATYFATERVSFPWHQDYESFFTVQNHYDYLNLYVPVVKPRRDKSNLSVVPFDALQKESPKTFRRLVRSGASRFRWLAQKRLVFFDDTATVHLARVDIDRMASTPMLDAGDLLIMRGDVIHQTQDRETQRVALSFRVGSSKTVIRRSRLADGGWVKARIMMNNCSVYEKMFRAFDEARKDELELRELLPRLETITVSKPKDSREFLKYLLWQKRRAHVLLPFARKLLTTTVADWAASYYESWRTKHHQQPNPK